MPPESRVLLRRLSLTVRIAWSKVLDVVKPKRDYAGKYPRIRTASPAEAERIAEINAEILRGHCEHDWEYMHRQAGETYTGYCERCVKCGEIVQVSQ